MGTSSTCSHLQIGMGSRNKVTCSLVIGGGTGGGIGGSCTHKI